MPRFVEVGRTQNAQSSEKSANKMTDNKSWLKVGVTFSLTRIDEVTTEFGGETYVNTTFVTDKDKDFYGSFATKVFDIWDTQTETFVGEAQQKGALCTHIRKIVAENPNLDDTAICNKILTSKVGNKKFTNCVWKVTAQETITIFNDWDDKPKRKRIYTIDLA